MINVLSISSVIEVITWEGVFNKWRQENEKASKHIKFQYMLVNSKINRIKKSICQEKNIKLHVREIGNNEWGPNMKWQSYYWDQPCLH
jgi:hypothetical protein